VRRSIYKYIIRFRYLPRRGHDIDLGYNFLFPCGTDFAVVRGLQTHSYANAVPGCFYAGEGAALGCMNDLVVDTELRKMHNALDVELSIRRIREAM
jgi:hypothetical protein